jgi:glutathione S-transferase
MREFYHSYLSPYARRVLIVLAEKGMEHSHSSRSFRPAIAAPKHFMFAE